MNTVSTDTPATSARRKSPSAAPTKASTDETTPVAGVASVTQLVNRLSEYLNPSELKKIKEAYRFSDEMHLGQMRKSGEPYISHPIAVAEICADWKLDAQAIMAALLHDVMEDSYVVERLDEGSHDRVLDHPEVTEAVGAEIIAEMRRLLDN